MTDQPERSSEAHGMRRRRITRTAVSGMLAKAAMFLPTVAITRIVVPILGPERFGVLMTILSLLAFLGVADLGVGGSLVTSISRAVGSGDQDRVRRLQANGLVAVAMLAALLLVVALALFFSDVGSLIFASSPVDVRNEATRGLAVFALMFALSLPVTLVGKIQLGLQRGDLANYWQTGAALINFGGGVLTAWSGRSIPWIVMGLMCGTILCGFANLVTHFYTETTMRPVRGDITRAEIRVLLADSLFYLALQVLFVVAYAADTLIVARQLGAAEASVYALSERLFSIVAVAVAVISAPLWAAYGEALGARDWAWAGRTLRLSTLRIAVAGAVLSAIILILLQPLVGILSMRRLMVPMSLGIAMASWRVIEAVGSSLSVYMYASQSIRFVLAVGSVTAAVSLIAKVILVAHFGMYAIPIAMSVCYALLCLLPTLYYVRRVLIAPGVRLDINTVT